VVCKEVVVHVADVLLTPASPGQFVNVEFTAIVRETPPKSEFAPHRIELPPALASNLQPAAKRHGRSWQLR
jgi:hypothetical protein